MTESHKSESIGRLLLLVLIGVSAIGPVTMNGVLSANSAIMQEFSVDYAVVQAVVTVYLVATFISQLILGPLADRIGRRPVMIGAMSIFVVGSVLCSLASSMEWLLVFRFVQGFGAAVCVLLPRTIVRDIYPVDKAASMIGYMTTAMMVAPLFGPFAGGWITDNYSWRLMYAGLAFLGIVLVLLAYLFQYETLADTNHAQTAAEAESRFWRSIIELLKSRRFQGYMALQAGAVGGYFAFLAGAPYVAMENRGLSASQYGLWFMLVAIGYLIGNLIAGRFSVRVGAIGMIRIGLIPMVIGTLMFWVLSGWQHPAALFLPMNLIAISNGVSLPNLVSLAMSVRPELAASASGLTGSAQISCGVALTLIVGIMLPRADYWLYVVISFSCLLAIAGFLIARSSPNADPH